MFRVSAILGFCDVGNPRYLQRFLAEHIVIYGVRRVWAGGVRGGGDSSVVELRWKDLIRSLFRVSLPSHFFAIDVRRHI